MRYSDVDRIVATRFEMMGATKPLDSRNILVSKQSVRVARGHHRTSACTLHRFPLACRPLGPGRSQPRSMPDACRRMAVLSVLLLFAARSKSAFRWVDRFGAVDQ